MPTKILAIDDSKTIRLAIKITFAAEDADVTTVSKGAEAVARAKQMGANVVIVDANLADQQPGGLELVRQLKSDPGTAKIPVIVLVSNQSPPSAAELDAAGADDTIAKPFDTTALIEAVAAVQTKPARAASAAGKPAAAPKPVPKPVPAAAPPVAKPVAAPPAAAVPRPPAARPPLAKPPAAKPPVARPTPAAKAPPVGRAARLGQSAAPAAAAPTAPKGARVGAVTEVGMPTPVTSAEAAAVGGGAAIPIAVPIPFTAASAPTPGMLKRLAEAAGDSGLDPKVAEALVSLSREVLERVVWEVVPDLAESIIKKAAAQAR